MARLTPGQALVIAAEVLGELAERHAAGRPVGGFDEHGVGVGLDGRARLVVDPSVGGGGADADVASARRLLARLGRNLQDGAQHGARNGRRAELVAAEGALTGALDPDGGIAASAVTLGLAAAPASGQARSELAALVSALAGGIRPEPAARAASPAPAPPRPAGAGPDDRPAAGGWRAAWHTVRVVALRSGRWCLAGLALVGLLAIEFVVFGGRIESDLATLHAAGSAAGRPTATASAAPTPPAPAPSANGPIARVDLRPLTRCAAGQPCETRLQVRLRPGATADEVRWTFRLTDRCTNATWTVPGGSMRVGPGGDQLAAVGAVPLPPGRALAVTAVVDAPARAASPPLLVPADATC